MFSGELESTIDEKKRIPIPSEFLKQLGGVEAKVIVIKNPDKCLYLFPATSWKEIEKMFEKIPSLEQLPIRALGKISISLGLREYAGLEKEVVFANCNDYFEIWDKQRWVNQREKSVNLLKSYRVSTRK